MNTRLQKAFGRIRTRLGTLFGLGFSWLMKVLYFGGVPLSIAYGKLIL